MNNEISKTDYSKVFMRPHIVADNKQISLSFYLSPRIALEEKKTKNDNVQILRLRLDNFTFGRDYEEYFDGLNIEESEIIFEGPMDPAEGSKYIYCDSDVQLGKTYAYWISIPGKIPTGPVPVTLRSKDVWWSEKRIQEEIKSLVNQYPELVKANKIGKTVKGKDIFGLTIGENKSGICLVGAIHPSESGPEIILKALNIILMEQPEILNKLSIYAIPVVNLDERERASKGVPWYLRKNANGVDLNRNCPADWNVEDCSYGLNTVDEFSATYRGPYPASEPEVQAVIEFIKKVKPDMVLSYHHLASIAGWQLLLPKEAQANISFAEKMQKVSTAYAVGYKDLDSLDENLTEKPIYNATSGSLPNWCYKVMGIPGFDVEWGGGIESSLTGKTSVKLLEDNQRRHADGILKILELMLNDNNER